MCECIVCVCVRACVRACVRVTWCGRGAGSETVVGMEGSASSAGAQSRQAPADGAGTHAHLQSYLLHWYKSTNADASGSSLSESDAAAVAGARAGGV